ncbi:MAG: hypothetical protein MK098_07770, partial [Marinovum sp.]|nr:hypothetical protein [Marinovum sp.]
TIAARSAGVRRCGLRRPKPLPSSSIPKNSKSVEAQNLKSRKSAIPWGLRNRLRCFVAEPKKGLALTNKITATQILLAGNIET